MCRIFSCVCAVASKKRLRILCIPRTLARGLSPDDLLQGRLGRTELGKGISSSYTRAKTMSKLQDVYTSFVDCCRCPSKLADVGTVSFCFFMLPASTLPPFASQSACPRKDTAVARYLLVAWRSMLCGRISFRQCLTRKEGHATKETTQKRENHVADKRRHNSKLPNIGAPRHEAGVARFVTREGAGRSDQAC